MVWQWGKGGDGLVLTMEESPIARTADRTWPATSIRAPAAAATARPPDAPKLPRLGQRVVVQGRPGEGTVRWVGEPAQLGVELDAEVEGGFGHSEHFDCAPGRGVFAGADEVTVVLPPLPGPCSVKVTAAARTEAERYARSMNSFMGESVLLPALECVRRGRWAGGAAS